ncbi:MAG: hypothetical protein ACYC5O_08570 [Anaerolineae bacterium]
MSDTSNENGRWHPRRLSAVHVLGVGLLVNLSLVAYLLYRVETQSIAAEQATSRTQLAAAAEPSGTVQPVAAAALAGASSPTALAPLAASAAAISATPDIDAMMQQLQEMQLGLQAMSGNLSQLQAAAPVAVATVYAPTATATAPDLAGMLAEIEQLYQQMLPLDQQMQAAMRSSRPESELAAMRTQMESIHFRLSDLMTRVEAARAAVTGPSTAPAGSYSVTTPPAGADVAALTQSGADQVTYQQLEQMLAELQSTLQQMQSSGTSSPMSGEAMPTAQLGAGQDPMSGDGSMESLVPMVGDMVTMMGRIVGEMRGMHGPPAMVGEGR